MGSGGSKTAASASTQSIVDVLTNSIMKCSGNSVLEQSFKIVGNYNTVSGVKQVQALNLSTQCANNTQNLTDLQQTLATAIQQAASAQSVALFGAANTQGATVRTQIQSDVEQHVNQTTLTVMIQKINVQQNMAIIGDHNIVKEFSQEQTASIVQSAAQEVLNKLTSVQEIQNAATAKAESTQTNPISEILDSVFSGLNGTFILMLIGFIVVVCAIAYIIISGGPVKSMIQAIRGESSSAPEPPPLAAVRT